MGTWAFLCEYVHAEKILPLDIFAMRRGTIHTSHYHNHARSYWGGEGMGEVLPNPLQSPALLSNEGN